MLQHHVVPGAFVNPYCFIEEIQTNVESFSPPAKTAFGSAKTEAVSNLLNDPSLTLEEKSKKFHDDYNLTELDRGGHGVVYDIKHTGCVMKVRKDATVTKNEKASNAGIDHEQAVYDHIINTASKNRMKINFLPRIVAKGRIRLDPEKPAEDSFIIMQRKSTTLLRSRYSKEPFIETLQKLGLTIWLLMAINKLHSMGVTHCDIKDGNVMLDKGLKDPVFIDFGGATFLDSEGELHKPPHSTFTAGFVAPEVRLARNPQESPMSDVWSVGCTLAMLWSKGKSRVKSVVQETPQGRKDLEEILDTDSKRAAQLKRFRNYVKYLGTLKPKDIGLLEENLKGWVVDIIGRPREKAIFNRIDDMGVPKFMAHYLKKYFLRLGPHNRAPLPIVIDKLHECKNRLRIQQSLTSAVPNLFWISSFLVAGAWASQVVQDKTKQYELDGEKRRFNLKTPS